jgi:uncharacterized protein (DUF1330 family)
MTWRVIDCRRRGREGAFIGGGDAPAARMMETPMPTYAVGRLSGVTLNAEIVAYLEQIDATLAPHGGRFVVHGGPVTVLEGAWAGDLVVIAFPDRAAAEGWYASPAYRAILPLRTRNAACDVVLIEGVEEGHRATDVLPREVAMRAMR